MGEPPAPPREVIVTLGEDDSVGKKMLRDYYARRRQQHDPCVLVCPCGDAECSCRFRS